MDAIRLNKLAKELGTSNKGLARAMDTVLGVKGKSHSSTISPEMANKLRMFYKSGGFHTWASARALEKETVATTSNGLHFFEEKVWAPLRQKMKEPEQAEAWRRLETAVPDTLKRLKAPAHLPPEVVLPGEAYATIFLQDVPKDYGTPYETPKNFEDDVNDIKEHLKDMGLQMAMGNFFEAYRENKVIYRLNHALVEALASVKPPDDYPTEALNLPRQAVVIDLSETLRKDDVIRANIAVGVSYDLATGLEHEGTLMLRFTVFAVYPGMSVMPVPIANLTLEPGKSLRQSVREVGIQFEKRLCEIATETLRLANQDGLNARRGEILADIPKWSHLIEEVRLSEAELVEEFGRDLAKESSRTRRMLDHFSLAINALLYIQSEEDIVRVVHPGQRPPKASTNPEKNKRFKDIAPAEIFEVGQRYAATIERWEKESAELAHGNATGKSVRPHMRSAHPHLYRIGPGRKDYRVRFLAPISVKGGASPEETTPVIAQVK